MMSEATARRKLKKHGLYLKKSRKNYWTQNDYCEYAIFDSYIGFVIAGYRYDLKFVDVVKFIEKLEQNELIIV